MGYLLSLAIDPAVWIALLAVIAMEVVLGIDNLIFCRTVINWGFVTLRACPRPLRTLTLGQNNRIWQSALQENARRKLSRPQANFPGVISGLEQTRISDEHAK